MSEGRLAVVLHSHLPYVEGFGTWPFGEEWLWEAIATSYLPLLGVLEAGAPVTLSLTPVLCDQLEAPGAIERCRAFLRDVRPASHALDIEAAEDRAVATELERAAGEYALALERLPDDLLTALAPFAAWTSTATHAVLPLLATDAGVRLQVRTGVESHRARFGDGWRGGFWLPECAQAPWLHACLEEAGVHATCVDLTDVLGPGDARHLRPLATEAGPLLVPIDRAVVDLVWSSGGYPSHAAYRDHYHRTAREGLELVHLDDALADCQPAPAGDASDRVTTWGTPRDLSTWSGPQVADLAWIARAAELDVLAAGPRVGDRAVRELLALQSSDWAFLASAGTAGDYPRERFLGHAREFRAALADPGAEPALRNLAPRLARAALLEP